MTKTYKTKGVIRAVAWVFVALAGVFALVLAASLLVYPSEYVFRVLAWGDSDSFDWQKFPEHRLDSAPTAFRFDEAPDDRVAGLFSKLAGVDDWDAFLEENHTQAFIVIRDKTILYEKYFNDTDRDSIVTSFSVAKSFTSALIGIAVDEGLINSIDDPITDYLPELAQRDPRFGGITIRHLLLMSSGMEYKAFRFPGLNSDDPLTTYYPDQRQLSLQKTRIIDPPGVYFQYNKYHPQLLGMILERTTGGSVTEYLQKKIWDPLGMEFSGSWSIDSERSGFEKMETGVNARAVDFAKFGQLFLNEGAWEGRQVISKEWVAVSTRPYLPSGYAAYYPGWFSKLPGLGYYKYMWWGIAREEGGYDFSAEGDKGQYIYISPSRSLVIVRNGIDYGISFNEWFELFYEFAGRF
ncbi:MAG TPA: serine hydrolase [Spirochaetota bacterium]|nr:serine hydrolase [Spirochaetota bacterium]